MATVQDLLDRKGATIYSIEPDEPVLEEPALVDARLPDEPLPPLLPIAPLPPPVLPVISESVWLSPAVVDVRPPVELVALDVLPPDVPVPLRPEPPPVPSVPPASITQHLIIARHHAANHLSRKTARDQKPHLFAALDGVLGRLPKFLTPHLTRPLQLGGSELLGRLRNRMRLNAPRLHLLHHPRRAKLATPVIRQ